mmetsp:Transcript_71825/g.189389  ORF Transcript_71825/g.189389 Transcript_71825/m.189389 type:complete len:241 (-) Transcript_71825:329-1051(-)
MPAWYKASTMSSFLPAASRPFFESAFLSSSTDMFLSSLRLLASASSCCCFSSNSCLRRDSFSSKASTMSAFLPFLGFSCFSVDSGAIVGRANLPAVFSVRTSRSTITCLTRGSTPTFSQSRRNATLSMPSSSCSRSSQAIFAKALSTPSACCQSLRICSMRACLVNCPLMPCSLHTSLNSGKGKASNSPFLLTTTARNFALCALASARSLASNATTASIMSSFLHVSRPLLVVICFNSSM